MIAFFEQLIAMFSAQVIGGSGSVALYLASFLLCAALLVVLLVVRFPFEYAFIITSPAIVAMSFAGWLPPVTLGPAIILTAIFWAGLILAIAGK